MIEHEGPYLVHCTEGKDRAGFVSARRDGAQRALEHLHVRREEVLRVRILIEVADGVVAADAVVDGTVPERLERKEVEAEVPMALEIGLEPRHEVLDVFADGVEDGGHGTRGVHAENDVGSFSSGHCAVSLLIGGVLS